MAASSKKAPAIKNTERILRIGIIHGGRIIEERLLRKRRPVTIGQSVKSTFVLPVSNLPVKYSLFEVKANQYLLAFNDKMDGRVSVDGAVVDFKTLKNQNLVKKRGSTYLLPLSYKSRGKVIFGEVTLLFQFVVPPPIPIRPQLPSVVKGGWIKNIDWIFVTITMCSLVVHTVAVWYMANLPIDRSMTAARLSDRFAKLLGVKTETAKIKPTAIKLKEVTTELALAKAEAKAEEEANRKAAEEAARKSENRKKGKGSGDPVKDAKAAAERRLAYARSKVAKSGMVAVLAALGNSGLAGGPVGDLHHHGKVDRDLDLNMSKGGGTVGVAKEAHGRGRSLRGSGGGGKNISIKGRKVSSVTKVAMARKKVRKVTAFVKASGPSDIDGDLSGKAIANVVRRRIRAIKQCYERVLKRFPDLQGKIVVQFTISGDTGRVIKARIESNTMGNAEVSSCILRRIRRWRFPKPEGGNVTVAYPFTFIGQH